MTRLLKIKPVRILTNVYGLFSLRLLPDANSLIDSVRYTPERKGKESLP